jgi:hypothetical protein
MSATLLDEPLSPELVLVLPPEEAAEVRRALPDVREFYVWVDDVRRFMSEPEHVRRAEVRTHERGTLAFALVVCLNALIPFALAVAWKYFT